MTNCVARLCMISVVPLLLLFAGCSNGVNGKYGIDGTIKFQGKPLDQGTISFYTSAESPPSAECLITDGVYSIPAEQGLEAGNYVVRIRSTEGFEITPEDYAAGKTAPPARERLPAEYNEKTKQSVEVQASGSNTFDFDIP